MGCGVRFAKFVLIFFNVIFFLTGACLLGIGLWIRVDDDVWDHVEFLDVDDSDPLLEVGTYVLMGIGGFILLFGFIGCVGAMCENECMLGTYIVVLTVVLLAEIATAVLILIYREEVEDEVMDELEESFEDDFSYRNGKWSNFAQGVNFVQRELDCCGIEGQSSYQKVPDNKINQTELSDDELQMCMPLPAANAEDPDQLLPATCFVVRGSASSEEEDDLTCSQVHLDRIHSDNCEDELTDWFEEKAIIFIALAIGFACIQVFGLVFAICLCRVGGKEI